MLTLYKTFIGLRQKCLEYLVYEKYLALFDYLTRDSTSGSYVIVEFQSHFCIGTRNAGPGCS